MKEKRIAPMYKVINGKRVPVCDYHGECTNKAHKEVYPSFLKGKDKKRRLELSLQKAFQTRTNKVEE